MVMEKPEKPEEQTNGVPPSALDLTNHVLKLDHFDRMHVLKDTKKHLEGAPNYRGVAGFPVFGTGQPTEMGYFSLLAKLPKGADDVPAKIKWFNMRQQPVLYINGSPYVPRDPKTPQSDLEVTLPVPDLEKLQAHFLAVVKDRVEAAQDKRIVIHKDILLEQKNKDEKDAEEDLKWENVIDNIKADTVRDIGEVFTAMKGQWPMLELVRVPFVEEKAYPERSFDLLVDELKDEPASTTCVFSCQAGRGRTTMGMVVATLIKEIMVTTSLKKTNELGLVPDATVESLINATFEAPLPKTEDDDDPYIKGEFDVIKDLIKAVPEAEEAKRKIDYIIDVNGPAPKGIGIQNLRMTIIETKWKFDATLEENQGLLKQNILDFMERYFYLICFTTYALKYGPDGYKRTFVHWMDEHSALRELITQGKGKLEWNRKVDPEKLIPLRNLINTPNYKDNLGELIKTVYDFAFQTYADLPRGQLKNANIKKLAARTLMEILPDEVADSVNEKLAEEPSLPRDFTTLIGLVSYYGAEISY